MTVSRTTSVSQPGSLPGYPGLATISIAALLASGFFVDVALPSLRLDPEALARYWPRRWWLLVHIAAGAVALLTGPVQLWLGISGRRTPGLLLGISLAEKFGLTLEISHA